MSYAFRFWCRDQDISFMIKISYRTNLGSHVTVIRRKICVGEVVPKRRKIKHESRVNSPCEWILSPFLESALFHCDIERAAQLARLSFHCV